jgi:hypothetical protein
MGTRRRGIPLTPRIRGVAILGSVLVVVLTAGHPAWAGVQPGNVDSVYSPDNQVSERDASGQQPRIVGGNTTTSSKYPWQAALVYDASFGGSDFDRFFCGASLIHPYMVMTAAHCVFDTDPD